MRPVDWVCGECDFEDNVVDFKIGDTTFILSYPDAAIVSALLHINDSLHAIYKLLDHKME